MGGYLHMLHQTGWRQNVGQLFGKCIPLTMPMYCEINKDKKMATVGSERVNKFLKLFIEICSFQTIFLVRCKHKGQSVKKISPESTNEFHTSKNHEREFRYPQTLLVRWMCTNNGLKHYQVSQVTAITQVSTSIFLTTSYTSSHLFQIDWRCIILILTFSTYILTFSTYICVVRRCYWHSDQITCFGLRLLWIVSTTKTHRVT